MNFEMGERFVFVEEKKLGKTQWNQYYSVIDFDECTLGFYESEKKEKKKKFFDIKNCEFYDAVKMKNRPCTIKVQPQAQKQGKKKPKPLYISTDSLRSVELEECSGTFEGLDKKERRKHFNCLSDTILFAGSTGAVLRLEHIDVQDWTKKDVGVWLGQIKKGKISHIFRENDIDGAILEELDEQSLINIQVPEADAVDIVIEIGRLKKNRKFSVSRFMVKSKFERFPGFSSQADEFQDMIDSLCDQSRLKHKFLNTADLQAHTLQKKKKMGGAKMMKLSEEYMEEPLEEFREAKIKIKIVVTEILHTAKAKTIRKMVSPIFSAVPKLKNEFGFFHTAIIVGPWYLEWTDSELVIPKRMVSGRAIISADVDTLNVPKNGLKEISDKIAEVVVKWNTKFKYKNTSQQHKYKDKDGNQKTEEEIAQYEGNCQDFVDDILHALGISCDFGGALGGFIKKMRSSGKCVLEFSPCKEFRDFFGIKETSWVFKTHEELDSFCCRVKEQCLDVYITFSSEWSLLKSFDRAFWLRHLKMPEDPRYTPLPPKERTLKTFDTGCPFDDPRNTKSYT